MPLGHDRGTWRTIVLLTAATIASGLVGGLVAYIAQERPEEATCADLRTDTSKKALVAVEVARDLDIHGQPEVRVALVAAEELERACARSSSSDRPVNSDLRGTIRQRLEGSRSRGGTALGSTWRRTEDRR